MANLRCSVCPQLSHPHSFPFSPISILPFTFTYPPLIIIIIIFSSFHLHHYLSFIFIRDSKWFHFSFLSILSAIGPHQNYLSTYQILANPSDLNDRIVNRSYAAEGQNRNIGKKHEAATQTLKKR